MAACGKASAAIGGSICGREDSGGEASEGGALSAVSLYAHERKSYEFCVFLHVFMFLYSGTERRRGNRNNKKSKKAVIKFSNFIYFLFL